MKHGGDRKSKTFNPVTKTKLKRDSNYYLGRLKRDYPQIYEQYQDGIYKSVRQACIEAGIIKTTKTSQFNIIELDEIELSALNFISGSSTIIKELTEYKQAKKKLAQPDKKKEQTAKTVLGQFTFSLEGKLLKANAFFANIFGYQSIDELLTTIKNESKELFAYPDTHRYFFALLEENDGYMKTETMFRHKDGSYFFAGIYARSVKDSANQADYIEGFVEDISYRKKREKELEDYCLHLEDFVEKRTDKLKNFIEQLRWELKKSYRTFEIVMDSLDAGIYVVDINSYEILFVNKYIREQLGDVVGKTCWQVILKEQNKPCEFCNNELLISSYHDSSKVCILEYYNSYLNKWYEVRSRAIHWLDGRLVRINIETDISEHKNSEQVLQESKDKFRAIADYGYDWENWVSPKGSYLWINPAVERIIGYSEEECNNMVDFPINIIYQGDQEKMRRHFANAINGGSGNNIEFRIQHKNAKIVWVGISYQPIFNSESKCLGYRSSIRDISELKKVEQELRESEERFRRLSESAFEGIIIHEDGDIIDVNKRMATIFGYEIPEMIGKNFIDKLIYQDNNSQLEQKILHNHEELIESRGIKKDGSLIFIEIIGSKITHYKGLEVRVAVIRDITTRKKAEEELIKTQGHLIQSEKLASLGKLVSGIAHEINNPINFIVSGIDPLKERLQNLSQVLDLYQKLDISNADKLNIDLLSNIRHVAKRIDLDKTVSDIGELVNSISNGADRAAKILKDMQQFSSGKKSNVLEKVKITNHIDSVLNLLHNLYKNRIIINKDYLVAPMIECHSGRLDQVLINLLANAIQAIEQEGEINIKTYIDHKLFCIMISDTGQGISTENLQKIFDPFFSTKTNGSGLGLSISYEIIKEHQGTIEVVSQLNHGSQFTIKLPIIRHEL